MPHEALGTVRALTCCDTLRCPLEAQMAPRSPSRHEERAAVVPGEAGHVPGVAGERHAAAQVWLAGRGRPRNVAAADSLPQITATLVAPGITGMSVSQSSGMAWLPGPW